MSEELIAKLAPQLHQNLAKEECQICKALFGEHSPEEFKAHALGDLTIDLNIQQSDPEKLKRERNIELLNRIGPEEDERT